MPEAGRIPGLAALKNSVPPKLDLSALSSDRMANGYYASSGALAKSKSESQLARGVGSTEKYSKINRLVPEGGLEFRVDGRMVSGQNGETGLLGDEGDDVEPANEEEDDGEEDEDDVDEEAERALLDYCVRRESIERGEMPPPPLVKSETEPDLMNKTFYSDYDGN